MKVLRLLLFFVIGFAIYAAMDTKEDRGHISDLKSKSTNQLTNSDKEELVEADKSEKARLVRKEQYDEEQRKEALRNKPKRDFLELQLNVRIACENTARSLLKFPDSYEDVQHEDGVSDETGKSVYFFTLHYSAVNAFNVRSTSTIECYADVGDPNNKITYRSFE